MQTNKTKTLPPYPHDTHTRTWRYVHTLTPEAGAERGPWAGRGRQESAGGQQRGHCVPVTQLVRAVKASQPPGRSRARGRPQH